MNSPISEPVEQSRIEHIDHLLNYMICTLAVNAQRTHPLLLLGCFAGSLTLHIKTLCYSRVYK